MRTGSHQLRKTNPKGIVSSSPGLRRVAGRYPGCRRDSASTPTGLRLTLLLLATFWFSALPALSAMFTNNASVQVVNDSTGSLTFPSGAFTVSCWFRISIPSSLTLSDNMDILMDRSDGDESGNFSYLLRYNYANNAVEFVTHGSSGTYSKTLIQGPYLERWHHVAVTRSGATFTAYVDGRPILPSDSATIGTTGGSGLAVGGIGGSSKQFYGD